MGRLEEYKGYEEDLSSAMTMGRDTLQITNSGNIHFHYSRPPIPPISGLTKKRQYSEIGGIRGDDCITK